MNSLSFMGANLVARQLNYAMSGGWEQGERATNEYFRPLDTFGERFAALLVEIQTIGFQAIDLWTAHLNPQWATNAHIAIARDLLAEHSLTVTSLTGGLGATRNEVEASCQLATMMDTAVFVGHSELLHTDRSSLVSILQTYDVRLGVQNLAEKTPEMFLAKIGGGDDYIRACVNTGWFGAHGFDAVLALVELRNHLLHLQIADVRAIGAYETCRYGRGIVPIRTCVQTIKRMGYTGPISVVHQPAQFSPLEDCRASLRQLRRWIMET